MREAHLRDFIAVLETGSVRAAARRLGLTQAAVSKNLSALERRFGVPLLYRSAHGVEPTEYGKLVMRRSRVVDSEWKRLDDEIAALSGERLGLVAIALSATAEALLMPQALTRFRQEFAQTPISISGGPPGTMLTALREGKIDFAVAPAPPSLVGADTHVERLLSTDLVVVGRAGHPLRGVSDLAAYTACEWIVGARQSQTEAAIEAAFAEKGLRAPVFIVQRDSLTAQLHLLLQSDLLAAASEPAIELFCRHGMLAKLPAAITFAPMIQNLITSATRPLAPGAEALAQEFRRASRAHRR